MNFIEATKLMQDGHKVRLSTWSQDSWVTWDKSKNKFVTDGGSEWLLYPIHVVVSDWVEWGEPVVLKPCPFCGASPSLLQTINNSFYIRCCNIDCPIDPRTGYFDKPDTTAKKWNKRVSLPCPFKTDEELVQLGRMLRDSWTGAWFGNQEAKQLAQKAIELLLNIKQPVVGVTEF
jgi:hypothetical protein